MVCLTKIYDNILYDSTITYEICLHFSLGSQLSFLGKTKGSIHNSIDVDH